MDPKLKAYLEAKRKAQAAKEEAEKPDAAPAAKVVPLTKRRGTDPLQEGPTSQPTVKADLTAETVAAAIRPPPEAYPSIESATEPDRRSLDEQLESTIGKLGELSPTEAEQAPPGSFSLDGQIDSGSRQPLGAAADEGLDLFSELEGLGSSEAEAAGVSGVEMSIPDPLPVPAPEPPVMEDALMRKIRFAVAQELSPVIARIESIESQVVFEGEEGLPPLKDAVTQITNAVSDIVLPVIEKLATEALDPDQVEVTIRGMAGTQASVDTREIEAKLVAIERSVAAARQKESQERAAIMQKLDSLQQQMAALDKGMLIEDGEGDTERIKDVVTRLTGAVSDLVLPVVEVLAPDYDAESVPQMLRDISRETTEGMIQDLASADFVDRRIEAKLAEATKETKEEIGGKVKQAFKNLNTQVEQKLAETDGKATAAQGAVDALETELAQMVTGLRRDLGDEVSSAVSKAEAAQQAAAQVGARLDETAAQLRTEAEEGFDAARRANRGIDNDLKEAQATLRQEREEKLDSLRTDLRGEIESRSTEATARAVAEADHNMRLVTEQLDSKIDGVKANLMDAFDQDQEEQMSAIRSERDAKLKELSGNVSQGLKKVKAGLEETTQSKIVSATADLRLEIGDKISASEKAVAERLGKETDSKLSQSETQQKAYIDQTVTEANKRLKELMEPAVKRAIDERAKQVAADTDRKLQDTEGRIHDSVDAKLKAAEGTLRSEISATVEAKADELTGSLSESMGRGLRETEAMLREETDQKVADAVEARVGQEGKEIAGKLKTFLAEKIEGQSEQMNSAMQDAVQRKAAEDSDKMEKALLGYIQARLAEQTGQLSEGIKAEVRKAASPLAKNILEKLDEALHPLRSQIGAMAEELGGDGTEKNPGLIRLIYGDPDFDKPGVIEEDKNPGALREIRAAHGIIERLTEVLETVAGPGFEAAQGVGETRLETTKRLLIGFLLENDYGMQVQKVMERFGRETTKAMLREFVEDPQVVIQELARVQGLSLTQLYAEDADATTLQKRDWVENTASQIVISNARSILEEDA